MTSLLSRDNLRKLNPQIYFNAAKNIADNSNYYSCLAIDEQSSLLGLSGWDCKERLAWEEAFRPAPGQASQHPFWGKRIGDTSSTRAERVIALTMMGNMVLAAKASRGQRKPKASSSQAFMQHMKFRVIDKAHNEAIQKVLFEKGLKWGNHPPNALYHPTYCEVNFLYADNGYLSFGELESTFDETDSPEYLLYQGEIVPAYPAMIPQKPSAAPELVVKGVAEAMPGTSGFTMVVFQASDVPVGTKVYA